MVLRVPLLISMAFSAVIDNKRMITILSLRKLYEMHGCMVRTGRFVGFRSRISLKCIHLVSAIDKVMDNEGKSLAFTIVFKWCFFFFEIGIDLYSEVERSYYQQDLSLNACSVLVIAYKTTSSRRDVI